MPTYGKMQCYSVFKLFSNELQMTLIFDLQNEPMSNVNISFARPTYFRFGGDCNVAPFVIIYDIFTIEVCMSLTFGAVQGYM